MYPRRSTVLAPLTYLCANVDWRWGEKKQRAFDEMKGLLATNCLNAYPDLNWPFNIVANASNHQLGVCIT